MTVEQLKRFALQTGAKVEVDGKVFNADMVKSGIKPAEVTVEPAPEEPKPDKNVLLMAEAVKFMVDSMDVQNQRMTAALLRPTPPVAAPVTEVKRGAWKFSIKRDRNDLITEIIATPAEK